MAYQLEGQLLEVCTCNVLCPCWIGEDPDGGTCDGVVAYRIERGVIDGVDVSGLALAQTNHIPGNLLQGNMRVALFVDARATPEQAEALVKAFTGQLGGPLADIAQLIGELITIERVSFSFEVVDGEGHLRIGEVVEAEMSPYRGPTGQVTTLNESIFSTIPGSPAYVAKASVFKRQGSRYGLKDIDLVGHNAIQGTFRLEA